MAAETTMEPTNGEPTNGGPISPAPVEDRKMKLEKPEKSEKPEKPEKPDEEKFKTDLAKAEKEHTAVMEQLNALRAKIDLAKPPAKGSPIQQRQQELRNELSSIRQQQQQLKSSKGNLQDRIKQLDSTIKSRITEQKTARARVPYKNAEEIDRQIQHLEKQVDAGTMKLVDEKKALAEVSNLRKQRKGFAQFDEAQKGIDDVKAQLAELRKGLDDPEAKALSEKYSGIAKELDDIKAEHDEAYKNINSLRDERATLQTDQQQKYGAIRALKDQYYGQKKAYADYEHEAYKARRERQKAERETYEKERRRKVADQKLEEAGQPAFIDEILTAEGLIRYFDPSAADSSPASAEPSKYAAQPSRTVDASSLKGTKVVKKDEREDNYFMGNGGKKGRKGRKDGNTASPARTPVEGGKFNLSMGVIEELSKVDIEPPMGQADVPVVVEKLKAKIERWKADQERQTKENVEKAQKEIDRLEAEAQEAPPPSSNAQNSHRRGAKDTARKPASTNGDVSASSGPVSAAAELAQEKDAMADAVEDMEKATLEDKEG